MTGGRRSYPGGTVARRRFFTCRYIRRVAGVYLSLVLNTLFKLDCNGPIMPGTVDIHTAPPQINSSCAISKISSCARLQMLHRPCQEQERSDRKIVQGRTWDDLIGMIIVGSAGMNCSCLSNQLSISTSSVGQSSSKSTSWMQAPARGIFRLFILRTTEHAYLTRVEAHFP
jgi:hypothetical protein